MAKMNFNLVGMLYLASLGFVVLQLASLVMVEFFSKPPIYVGGFVSAAILIGAIWAALGLVNRFVRSPVDFYYQKNTRKAILTIIISAAILYLIFTVLPDVIPNFFEASMVSILP